MEFNSKKNQITPQQYQHAICPGTTKRNCTNVVQFLSISNSNDNQVVPMEFYGYQKPIPQVTS